LYEFVYGIDFVFIEFFFRGFLILALARIAGPGVILPMASFYVFIHFGKPMGETISSFFGGTLLGIIAYYSRSIAGGIIVHMGIAWMMEAGALLSKIYK
jgi:membrane protease YdiL (CAAX protease family)